MFKRNSPTYFTFQLISLQLFKEKKTAQLVCKPVKAFASQYNLSIPSLPIPKGNRIQLDRQQRISMLWNITSGLGTNFIHLVGPVIFCVHSTGSDDSSQGSVSCFVLCNDISHFTSSVISHDWLSGNFCWDFYKAMLFASKVQIAEKISGLVASSERRLSSFCIFVQWIKFFQLVCVSHQLFGNVSMLPLCGRVALLRNQSILDSPGLAIHLFRFMDQNQLFASILPHFISLLSLKWRRWSVFSSWTIF